MRLMQKCLLFPMVGLSEIFAFIAEKFTVPICCITWNTLWVADIKIYRQSEESRIIHALPGLSEAICLVGHKLAGLRHNNSSRRHQMTIKCPIAGLRETLRNIVTEIKIVILLKYILKLFASIM